MKKINLDKVKALKMEIENAKLKGKETKKLEQRLKRVETDNMLAYYSEKYDY